MVGAGIKSSFRCKKIQSGKINICSTLAPKLSLIGGKPNHDWCINEILFPMSKNAAREEEHPPDFSTKHNSLQFAVFIFCFVFVLPMPKVGGAAYTSLLTVVSNGLKKLTHEHALVHTCTHVQN